jgi:dinuclear metal center YbgI/SA1388 family protein
VSNPADARRAGELSADLGDADLRGSDLRSVVEALDGLYPPSWAESWDAVGLVSGDLDAPVSRVLLAVDPVTEVIEEAVDWGADLLVTHHPLLLRPVHSVATNHPKGAAVTTLVRAGLALHVAHTNADVASPGVSDALASAIGVTDLRPLRPALGDALDKVVVFVPEEEAERVLDAMAEAGAGRIGAYDRAAWTSSGVGTFRPLPGADPTIGAIGRVERVAEVRLEMVVHPSRRTAVITALHAAHPYEEPAFDVIATLGEPGPRGTGRVGTLPVAEPLGAFVERVAAALPATPAGVRVAGRLDGPVRTVAVCGGAGDDLFDDIRRAGADVYVTADLRHHPASESLAHGRPALVDCSHWATEWPWLADVETRLQAALAEAGTTVETRVSAVVTDPWAHVVGPPVGIDRPSDQPTEHETDPGEPR